MFPGEFGDFDQRSTTWLELFGRLVSDVHTLSLQAARIGDKLATIAEELGEARRILKDGQPRPPLSTR